MYMNLVQLVVFSFYNSLDKVNGTSSSRLGNIVCAEEFGFP